MRYTKINYLESEAAVVITCVGCAKSCPNCNAKELGDFSLGKPGTEKNVEQVIALIEKESAKKVYITGGEPLAIQNIKEIAHLIHMIKYEFSDVKVGLGTGEYLGQLQWKLKHSTIGSPELNALRDILDECDYIIDGPYKTKYARRTTGNKYIGSTNQTIGTNSNNGGIISES